MDYAPVVISTILAGLVVSYVSENAATGDRAKTVKIGLASAVVALVVLTVVALLGGVAAYAWVVQWGSPVVLAAVWVTALFTAPKKVPAEKPRQAAQTQQPRQPAQAQEPEQTTQVQQPEQTAQVKQPEQTEQ